ncbi:MAG: leucine--tRNA ligase [Anaerolineae bacterium]|nr:leucine--tRNA ligase [Anaerolineae bacterium]
MSDRYVPQEIEPRWQAKWEETGIYRVKEDPDKTKFYFLTMFPYPSGDLHIGHWYVMAPSDAAARYRRMQGYNVLFPIGFDAFGLPAENAAINHGIHPKEWTYKNIERMRKQLRSMGAMFDWDREVVTCEPDYYKWNQWFFLKFFEKGLAYKKRAPVDFCPTCNTTLAREQVIEPDRVCERCGTPVIKKEMEQWFLKITDYAEELLDFSKLDWPERVKVLQTNWIGRSTGVQFRMEVKDHPDKSFEVFTTRPDTVYGVTFAVLAPEHPLVDELTTPEHREEVEAYKYKAARQSEIERLSTEKVRDGVFIGAYAINPMNGEAVPIFIADYVMMTYGTGAIMAVPAHDERDFDFARRYGLPIRVVIAPPDWDGGELEGAYTGKGVMVNSGPFDGLSNKEGWEKIADYMEEHGIGRRAVQYRLRDWLISRQRYWGTPIPVVYCEKCGIVPVPEDQLPVRLPDDAEFRPTGESPLKFHEEFLHTTCPKCGGPAIRETDTMDTFVDSSWYQYAYVSPYYDKAPFDPERGKYWLPVDQYTGGVEHATMHLLYTRFFTKAMRDLGLVDFDEPMVRLFNQGIILGPDGNRMSKSRGNVIAPDPLVKQYGADTVRAYLMFIGPWDQGGPWNPQGIEGVHRFLNRVWALVVEPGPEAGGKPEDAALTELRRMTHKTIKRATQDIEAFKFNTMLAALMSFTNYLTKAKGTAVYGTPEWDEAIRNLLLLMAPLTPHIAEELWARTGGEYSIHQQSWPTWEEELTKEETITLVVQVNGRVRDRVEAPADITKEQAKELALASKGAQRHTAGKEIVKIIYAPGRLVNIVVR